MMERIEEELTEFGSLYFRYFATNGVYRIWNFAAYIGDIECDEGPGWVFYSSDDTMPYMADELMDLGEFLTTLNGELSG